MSYPYCCSKSSSTSITTLVLLILTAVLFAGCGSESTSTDDTGAPSGVDVADTDDVTAYQPAVMVSWQWQLLGTVDTSYAVEIYDIDLFDTPTATIESLQASGKRIICYFSAGSYEVWRDDAGQFDPAALGNTLDGWEGERWLDIRDVSVRSIMQDRLDIAVAKGCDGVEPDNVDGYQNDPGFALTAGDQLDYNRFIAAQAHARGLAVGLKNDLDQVAELVDDFDFAVNEQCFEYDECDLLMPFIDSGKPVLNAEYRQEYVDSEVSRQALCADSVNRQFSTLVLPLDLDNSFRHSCL